MSLREVTYVDREGRKWRRMLPDHVPDSEAELGIPAGPPPLTRLALPLGYEVALHNELFARRLFTEADLRGRYSELLAAITSVLKLDAQAIAACYQAEPQPV